MIQCLKDIPKNIESGFSKVIAVGFDCDTDCDSDRDYEQNGRLSFFSLHSWKDFVVY